MLGIEAEDRDSMYDVTLGQDWQNVVPVAATVGDKIEALRQWASGRVLRPPMSRRPASSIYGENGARAAVAV
jgi:hypothetical protein